MSLISINNFTAPFKSKTHLITLVVVAAVMAMFRLAGGNMVTKERGNRRTFTVREAPQADLAVDPDVSAALPEYEVPTKINPSAGAFDDLLADDSESSASGRSKKPSAELDEIERQLGLR